MIIRTDFSKRAMSIYSLPGARFQWQTWRAGPPDRLYPRAPRSSIMRRCGATVLGSATSAVSRLRCWRKAGCPELRKATCDRSSSSPSSPPDALIVGCHKVNRDKNLILDNSRILFRRLANGLNVSDTRWAGVSVIATQNLSRRTYGNVAVPACR